MNIVTVIIMLVLLLGAAVGFARGFTKQLVSSIGMIVVIVLAFFLKNPIASFFYGNLPFFNFGGVLKGVSVLNILLYEMLAFVIVFSVLMLVFRLVLMVTSVFEKILTMTIILGIPSKLLGAVLGFIEYYILVFVVLYILTLPVFNLNITNSSLARNILNKTPIVSKYIEKTNLVINDFVDLKDKYEKSPNAEAFNLDAIDMMLEHKVVTLKAMDKLVDQQKIKVNIATYQQRTDKFREGE